MTTEDIENIRKNGFDVEEIPTGYIFTKYSGQGEEEEGSILIDRNMWNNTKNRKNRRDTGSRWRASSHRSSESNYRIRLENSSQLWGQRSRIKNNSTNEIDLNFTVFIQVWS
jgi:hypothetical protein